MVHNTLKNYYEVILALVIDYKLSIADIEELPVYERDIYLDLLKMKLEKEEKERNKAGY